MLENRTTSSTVSVVLGDDDDGVMLSGVVLSGVVLSGVVLSGDVLSGVVLDVVDDIAASSCTTPESIIAHRRRV